jgi:hypothetical protein
MNADNQGRVALYRCLPDAVYALRHAADTAGFGKKRQEIL